MKTISLREFSNLNLIKVLEMAERRSRIEVIDDQGEKVITDTWMMAFTWFSLGVHRYFNSEPYHVDEVVVLRDHHGHKDFIDDKKLKTVIDNFLARIMPTRDDPEFYDLIKQLVFVWHNQSHNFMAIFSESGAVSASSIDVCQIYKHPRIASIRERVKNKELQIGEAVPLFEEVMMTEADFDKSVFALLYRTRSVSTVQSFQLVIARGDVTDINGAILPNTVLTPYAEGITNLADSLADSKGSGFSLISNGQALQDSEWFHKKIHNNAQAVQGVEYQVDCGTTKGTVVKIISKEFRDSLVGKYRIMEDGSTQLLYKETLKSIKTGEYITYRSVAWCNNGRNGKPCAVCFGKMVSAIPYNPYTKRGAVPGLFYGSTFAEPIGQSILKSKHRLGSAESKGYVVAHSDKEYVTTDETGDFIYFNENILNAESDPYLILDKETQQDLSDYMFMESLDELNTLRFRTYESIKLKVSIENPMFDDRRATHFPIIVTTVASRNARMTKAFVEYLMSQPMEEEGRGFKISIKGFDPNEPAFELPQVNEDLDAYRKRVEDFFGFSEIKHRWDYKITPEIHGELIVGLWKVVDEKYKGANIIIHDIFLYACMVRDPENLNYGLPNASDERVMIPLKDSVTHGGMTNALLFGYQNESLLSDPYRFLIQNRKGGALESFMKPMVM